MKQSNNLYGRIVGSLWVRAMANVEGLVRIHITLSKRAFNELSRIQDFSEFSSQSQTVEEAILAMSNLLRAYDQGAAVFLAALSKGENINPSNTFLIQVMTLLNRFYPTYKVPELFINLQKK